MRIFLVRHGESEANCDHSVHLTKADHAMDLSPLGIVQATASGEFLAQYLYDHPLTIARPIDLMHRTRIWVSPYARTRHTAELIGNQLKKAGVPFDVKENINLVEQQFGLFDGLFNDDTMDQLIREFPREYAHYKKCEDFEGKFWARMPMGESQFDVALRVKESFGTYHRDAEKHGITQLIVVAHGLSIRAFAMQWLHQPWEWFNSQRNPKNCSIRLIDESEDKGYIYAGG